ncbi:RNA 2'-phosphotransferase [Aureisphaera galaxeae]|uniref:RNA 2'-phosphotransferase n=1 Tax=Aureisphaera galaxeae TaxID=1538023 RepID=UPI002350240C|nr:RNA 2'-phosphotransferase [Aureisphaera galaxeae]MDC8004705.1 RNA 2'-phosphotransferase [Aureisphaera galaxeae]
MTEKQTKHISKFLSLVLRHAPEKIGLTLDEAGWANVDELLEKMNGKGPDVDFEVLQYVVDTNNKKRFAFNDDKTKIRANQGHSITIEHGFTPVDPPEILYHGTGAKSVDSILQNGIEKRNRHHVHLSQDRETALKVGQRHGKPVVLEIMATRMQADGHLFYLSENDVWLTDFVPTQYIKKDP